MPTAFLTLAMQLPNDAEGSTLTVCCITAALGMSSFSLAGLYCSHQVGCVCCMLEQKSGRPICLSARVLLVLKSRVLECEQ